MKTVEWWDLCLDDDGRLKFETAIEFWADLLRQQEDPSVRMRYRDRQLLHVAEGIGAVEKVSDTVEAFGLASMILTRAWDLAQERDGTSAGYLPTSKHISQVMQDVMTAAENPTAGVVPTGMPTLDDMMAGGTRPGELIYLGARPGVGKTALALVLARCAAEHKKPTLVVSREMLAPALGRRMVAQAGRLNAKEIRLGLKSIWPRVVKTAGQLSTLPLWVTDDARGLSDIETLCDAQSDPPEFLIVDYLQLLSPPKGVSDRRHQVEAVSKGLKALATRRRIPVLCLSSLSRPQTRGETEPPPTLASLRESGELEHDADIVWLLHRERNSTKCECIVAKNRDGETGTVELLFTPESVNFAEASRRTEEESLRDYHAGRDED